jgi:hypothetical protein
MEPQEAVGAVDRDIQTWKGLAVTGGAAALASVALIVVQIGVYVAWPPPDTTVGFFALLVDEPLQGLLALDLLYIVSNLLTSLLYLALAVALWRVSRSGVVLALAFGVLGMAAYMASPRPLEMLALAQAHSQADPIQQVALVAAGDGMLATWTGTAFDVYYVFNFVTLLILAVLVSRSPVFTRATAVWGLTAAVLMAVPSNLGTIGLGFALASLLPWSVFAVLAGTRLLRLARHAAPTPDGSQGGPSGGEGGSPAQPPAATASAAGPPAPPA